MKTKTEEEGTKPVLLVLRLTPSVPFMNADTAVLGAIVVATR